MWTKASGRPPPWNYPPAPRKSYQSRGGNAKKNRTLYQQKGTNPSMRHYVAASELKEAGLDWRSLVLSRCLTGRALLVAQLKADPQYRTEAERLQAFLARGGGS
jgi:hypothetical protein